MTTGKRTITFTLETISSAAKEFINSIGNDRIFAFVGEMGAGKTTFISEICKILGAEDETGSPTFSLINEYADKKGNPIYHFDFYRIESPQEALDMGAEDYFYSDNLCLIEWPDRLDSLLPEDARIVNITTLPNGERELNF